VDLVEREVEVPTVIIAHAADKADANRISIVTNSMSPNNFMNPTVLDDTVSPDDVMIANIVEASLKMPLTDRVYTNVHRDFSVGTVNDDLSDYSHLPPSLM
jgi:hypothetical protein